MPSASTLVVSVLLLAQATLAVGSDNRLTGRVTAGDGTPVSEATILTADAGYEGWGETDSNGEFVIEARGAYISVRHPSFKPQSLPTADDQVSVEVKLEPRDGTEWQVPACGTIPGSKTQWIGGGLKVRNPTKYYERASGQHDEHWYVDFGREYFLHIVSGPFEHAGLPAGVSLFGSPGFAERGWISGEVFGVDFSGMTESGNRWRWIAPLMQDAISYFDVPPKAARYFDRIIETMCVDEP